LVVVVGLACLFPFLWMIRSSLMSNIEINTYPPMLWPETPRWENYATTLTTFPFGRYLINTLVITLPRW